MALVRVFSPFGDIASVKVSSICVSPSVGYVPVGCCLHTLLQVVSPFSDIASVNVI
jgi:hypothetical protein